MGFPASIRQVVRGLAIFAGAVLALLEQALFIPLHRRENRLQARAAWLHRWCRVACLILRLRVKTRGSMPPSGLLVSNHLTYLDIIVYSSLQPCVFVAKSEIARWPLFGWLTTAAGTIYVERGRKRDCIRAADQMRAALAANILVVLFPEGTSSGGESVLPLKPPLLEPAVELRLPITPATIGYALTDGSVPDEICYWRGMTFGTHVLNVLRKRSIAASIFFSATERATEDRKALAKDLHRTLSASLATHRA